MWKTLIKRSKPVRLARLAQSLEHLGQTGSRFGPFLDGLAGLGCGRLGFESSRCRSWPQRARNSEKNGAGEGRIQFPQPTLSVSQTIIPADGMLMVTWSGITAPTDWIGLFAPGVANTAFIEWIRPA
jgi:hypothetical protein